MSNATIRFYEFPAAFTAILDRTEEHGGELTPELEAELEALEGSFAEKADRIAAMFRQQQATAEAYKSEVSRLTDLAKGHANRAESLKRYLHKTMILAGYDKLATARFKLRVQKNSVPSTRFTGNPEDLPTRFTRIKTGLDAKAVAEAFKSGEPLPDGIEVSYGNHIVIA